MEADDATRTPEIFLQTLDRNPDGFETTDCLECLQILNILIYGRRVCCKAGDWILCTILGYGLPEREICDILLLSFIQTKWNQLSTDFVGPPFFQKRSIVSHAPVNQLSHACLFQEENIPLHFCNLQGSKSLMSYIWQAGKVFCFRNSWNFHTTGIQVRIKA